MRIGLWAGLVAFALAGTARAQEVRDGGEGAESEMELFELNDLLTRDVAVASQKSSTLREAPGVVTVVSREEIQSSGARDLIDVLSLVPGFWFGVDVEGVVDVGLRGVWAHEGKTLLLVDGVEMNELLYSNNELFNHYPLGNI